jgi:hypothetical protein
VCYRVILTILVGLGVKAIGKFGCDATIIPFVISDIVVVIALACDI